MMNNKSKNDNRRLKAVGIVEILIVLALIGVTMVSAMTVAADAFRSIRDNEIADTAAGFLVQGLEISKSPQNVILNDPTGIISGVSGSYRLNTSTTPASLTRVNQSQDLISSCNSNSPYLMDLSEEILGQIPKICLQVVINQVSEGYIVVSHVNYQTREGNLDRTLYGFRAQEFSK